MSKPARPDLKFASFDELINDAQQLRDQSYEKAGKWDLPMILDHLTKSMSIPFKPGISLPWPLNVVPKWVLHRFARREMYPEVKFPAPRFMQPVAGIEIEKAFAEFVDSAKRLQATTGEQITCPPIGQVNLDDFRKIQLLHGAHHLSFLKVKDPA